MKKIIMALSLCVFSFAAFAGEEKDISINTNSSTKVKLNSSDDHCTPRTTVCCGYGYFGKKQMCIVTTTIQDCIDSRTGEHYSYLQNTNYCWPN